MLGKRKRDHATVRRVQLQEQEVVQSGSDQDAADVFKKYFESRFEPLDVTVSTPDTAHPEALDDDSTADESAWSGIEDGETSGTEVEVVQHATLSRTTAGNDVRSEYKTFMSAKPPTASNSAPRSGTRKVQEEKDDPADAANLKNDFALQRLLKESHLLHPSTPSNHDRQKITESRLQAIGLKPEKQKMPASHRKGIAAKAQMVEERRRMDAKENGVILERASKVKQGGVSKRDRGVGGPGVGKFVDGTLKLSRRDVHEIQGPRRIVRGKGKGGR